MDRLRVRRPENNEHDRNAKQTTSALDHKSAGTIIIDEYWEKLARFAQRKRRNMKSIFIVTDHA
jgi:hypothetical protein